MRTILIATIAIALLAVGSSASPLHQALAHPAHHHGAAKACHNITGTCLPQGFVCANEEVIPHSQRCNGVEECADGTDEFMCEHKDHSPLPERSTEERQLVQQASCIQCACLAAVVDVVKGSAWFNFARSAGTDFIGLMTGTDAYRGLPCSSVCIFKIKMAFYRKNNVCRGWLCCARQRECMQCSGAQSTANRCYV